MVKHNNMNEKRRALEDEARELFYDLNRMEDILEPSVNETYFVVKYIAMRENDEREIQNHIGQSIFDFEIPKKKNRGYRQL